MKRRIGNTAQHLHEKVCKDDMIYCHGTARRAVARAALHLGIECMTAESIDVLAACLLDYLERIGAMMANNAEAAGRSSAHCNIYDAINAIELCTCAAAATTKSTNAMNGTANLDASDAADIGHSSRMDSFSKINLSNGTSWKDLASFCFGPNWNTNPSTTIGVLHDYNNQMNGGSRNATGGKAGPSAMLLMNGSSPLMSSGLTTNPAIVGQHTIETGWNAPYPDEIEQFPMVSNRGQVANPHPLPEPKFHRRDINILDSSSNLTLADNQDADKAHDYLNTIPDSVFQNKSGWGELVESNQANVSIGDKRSLETMDDDDSKPPPTKKVKLVESSSNIHEQSHPLFETLLLPTFYPPIPKPQNDDNRIVVTDGTDSKKTLPPSKITAARATSKAEEASNNEWDHNNPARLLVRSALVGRNLGSSSSANVSSVSSSFWGSSWSTTTNRSIDLVVPAGRPATVTGAGTSATDGSLTGANSSTASTTLTAPSIVPISRASGSRVSRILEGSMDPPII